MAAGVFCVAQDTREGAAGADPAEHLTGAARAMTERAGGVAALFVRCLLQAMRLGCGAHGAPGFQTCAPITCTTACPYIMRAT